MASPQLENGHTRIANELLEAWFKMPIGDMARAIMWVSRQTYGWRKKSTEDLTPQRLAKETGMGERQAQRVLKKLKKWNMITNEGNQKNYDEWENDKNVGDKNVGDKNVGDQTVGKSDQTVGKSDQTVASLPISKEKRKKEIVSSDGFDTFWTTYPRKVGKGEARRIWIKISPNMELRDRIIASILQQSATLQWTKDSGQWIPNPATWLNQERWEDEVNKKNIKPDPNFGYNLPCKKCYSVHNKEMGCLEPMGALND